MSTDQKTQNAAEAVTEYITITVAEYVCLVKAAAMLEVIANDPTYDHSATAAVVSTIQSLQRGVEAGAAE